MQVCWHRSVDALSSSVFSRTFINRFAIAFSLSCEDTDRSVRLWNSGFNSSRVLSFEPRAQECRGLQK